MRRPTAPRLTKYLALVSIGALITLAACIHGLEAPKPAFLLSITPQFGVLQRCSTLQLHVDTREWSGAEFTPDSVQWTSGDSSAPWISPSGLATGLNPIQIVSVGATVYGQGKHASVNISLGVASAVGPATTAPCDLLLVDAQPAFGTSSRCQSIQLGLDATDLSGGAVTTDSARWSVTDTVRVAAWSGARRGDARSVWVVQNDGASVLDSDGKPLPPAPCPANFSRAGQGSY